MNTAYLLTGGNLWNRENNISLARDYIEEYCGEVIDQSSVYETAAWGPVNQPAYLNQVLQVTTHFSAPELMQNLLRIEKDLGRHREERYGARTIDIDILFFNNETIDQEDLIIPHPRLYTRRFVLVPLNEIASQLVHPILQLSVSELLKQCTDPLDVKKYIAADDAE
jgi:2-amino-4-hydroxy-6-hydroxymethyldihydropteridine diphosphokinase